MKTKISTKLNIVLIFLSIFFIGAQNVSASTINKPTNYLGLIGYWTFDGKDMTPNVRDISGQGNHGIHAGQATTTTIGKVGQALTFDGVGYVSMGDVSTLEGMSAITVSAWVKSGDAINAGNQRIVSKSKNGQANGSWYIGRGDTEQLSFTAGNGTSQVSAVSDSVFRDTSWHHVVGTYDGANVLLYVDGVSADSSANSQTGSIVDSTYYVCIGRDSSGTNCAGGDPYNGSVDDVRIYNRAITANEVKGLYNSASTKFNKPNTNLTNGLVGHWTFDGKDMTPNVRDISGLGNHGTLGGQSATTTTIGKVGQALKFDGSNDYVSLGTGPGQHGSSAMSVGFWFRSRVGDSAYQTIITQIRSGFSGWYIARITNEKFEVSIDTSGSPVAVAQSDSSYADTNWHHVMGIYDGATVQVYVDGVATDSSPPSKSGTVNVSSGNSRPVCLGIASSGALTCAELGTSNLDSDIDDLRIYNRALSANEVKQLYNMGGTKINKPNTNLTNSLIGHWTFDGKDMTPNVRDISGQGNHGTLAGQSATTTAIGKIGQALLFDGVNDSVITTNSLSIGDTFTVSSWVKPALADMGDYNRIIETRYNDGFYLGTDTSGTKFQFIYNGSGGGFGNLISDSVFSPNTWYHVVGTYDGTYGRLYVNGIKNGSDTAFTYAGVVSRQAYIGRYSNTATNWWTGSIDDVRIYNRTLTATEIIQLYNGGK
jgi:hypothetical protein